MRRESHVRFWESAGVRFPRATRLVRSIKEERLDRMIRWGSCTSDARSRSLWSTIISNAIIKGWVTRSSAPSITSRPGEGFAFAGDQVGCSTITNGLRDGLGRLLEHYAVLASCAIAFPHRHARQIPTRASFFNTATLPFTAKHKRQARI